MTRHEKERFWLRDCNGAVVAKYSTRRQALDRARHNARVFGHEIAVYDSMATIGDVETWSVFPSGTVQAVELRTIETEKRDLQAGVER